MGVVEAATRLFDLLASREFLFTRNVVGGLSVAEIARRIAPTGIQLPDEAAAFYQHFNLPPDCQYSPERPAFFGAFWMLGLEAAVSTKECSGWKMEAFKRSSRAFAARWMKLPTVLIQDWSVGPDPAPKQCPEFLLSFLRFP